MAYDPAPQANAMAALRFDPQMNAITRQIEDLKAQTLSNNTGIDTYSAEGNTGINKSYDLLDTAHTNLGNAAMGALHTVGDKVGQGWADATAIQQANRDQSNKQLSDYAAKYGLQDVAIGNMSKLDEQIQKMIGTNTTRGAVEQGAADSIMGANKSFYDAWGTIDKATRAKQLGDFTTEIARARSANQLAGIKGQNDLYGRLNDVMGQRNSFLTDEMNQLIQSDWDREFKTNQAKWQADVENAKLAAQSDQNAKDESLGWARLMQEGIANEGQRLLGQQNADTASYTAHQPKEKPFNDLQVQQSIFTSAGGGNGNVPTREQLETSWDQHANLGLVSGPNPYSVKPGDTKPKGPGMSLGSAKGYIPFAGKAPNPLGVPQVNHERANDFLSKTLRWGSPWSRGNPFS